MKINFTIITLILFLIHNLSLSQCPPSNLYITSQASLDEFKLNYPNCEEIAGDLSVLATDITNLVGLDNIKSVKGTFFVTGSSMLKNFEGLSKLERIGDAVRIQSNEGLTSYEGLNNLKVVAGEYCYLEGSPLIKNLNGLNKLDSVMGIFQVWGMDEMTSLEGLESLKYVANDFAIFRNNNLKNLSGLGGLLQVDGSMRVYENNTINSLQGLNNEALLTSSLVVNFNPLLTTCAVEAICNYLIAPPSFFVFSDNAIGCNNENEVKQACLSSTSTSGFDDKIMVSSNPGDGNIEIIGSERIGAISVYDLFGKKISSAEAKNVINISNYPSGIYIIHLQIDSQNKSFKYLKVN
ncbi:MAG: T9SS type A sorting domain-containing protein [Saprospiraceae bacterium]|jgi:hypothetical protein|uniref:T9SS type A sorting domain-containing protein n=1 Tax=Candidatus Brachybacter algidus TaxID=2982024 RepID=UPI001B7971EC|nr:T9SS type A sorting domain-containing protein [Candidatus Brachybacter algidus]MBP7307643.1 T9SS type A sorting domain-containing protein [Saprospiraceae bacterium]MBK6373410.1 T9SS type A sorting domain-containing protein [Candidatus Brachybacter algidus]MBK7602873.1 T9SS type A sorting domain-containing protein [Candidatus Brachybacter algidus]MBK8354468.1 T9SS type A sorting domain-containing protein [Candidatus Brachybacter algidus]MBK9552140.1 T9SS type A sorting domain-containing prot